ncbi:MAG: type IV pilus secretin PilQ [Deltaproteobacteria bacterium]|nr:type IV pilus secretin PilQ [Deltaproteobacteria bacterium]
MSSAAADSRPSNQIRDVQITEKAGNAVVTVVGSKRPSYTAFKLSSPKRLVIDIANSKIRGVPPIIEKTAGIVSGVAVSEFSVKGVPVSRVMINFLEDAAYRVRVKGNKLVASLSGSPEQVSRKPKRNDGAEVEIARARSEAEKAQARSEAEIVQARSEAEKAQARSDTEIAKALSKAEKAQARSDTEIAKARLEAEKAQARAQDEVAKARSKAKEAKKLRDEARAELDKIKAELAVHRDETRKAQKEAKKASSRWKKASAQNAGFSQEIAQANRLAKKHRGQASRAEELARQEREKRIKLENRIVALEKQLDSATQAKLGAEDNLGRATKETQRLKQEFQARIAASTDAQKNAKNALNAQRKAAEKYRKAVSGEREDLRRVLRKRERETVEARQKLAAAGQDKKKTQNELARATRSLKTATNEAKEAGLEQERVQTQTDKALARARKRISEAEKAANLAEQRAKNSRIAKQKAEIEAEEIREKAARHKAAANRRADDRVAAAQKKLNAAKAAREKAKTKLHTAEKRVTDTEKQIAKMASELAKARDTIASQKKKLGEMAKNEAEWNKSKAEWSKNKAEWSEKEKSWNDKEKSYKNKLSQEELRLKRLAEMGREKPAQSKKVKAESQQTEIAPMIGNIKFLDEGDVQKIIISTDRPLAYTTSTDDNGSASIVFKGALLAPMLERSLDVTDFGGVVGSVSSYRDGDEVRVDINVERLAVNKISRDKNTIEWVFKSKKEKALNVTPDRKRRGTESMTVAREDKSAYAYPLERTAAASTNSKKRKRYTGRRIDLDFKDADIHNILRLLADVGHVNIITADDVKGAVTIRMRDVAWDHALDVILQAKRLGMVREGNLIRVAPLETLEKEREMEIARRKQRIALEPLETRLIPVSYAVAGELSPRAKDLVTERGTLSTDDRTNVIIARDTKGALDQIEALVRNLDTQTPQVLIEGRIVEATSIYAREIGIQWGGDFSASSATGNPTGLAFPSSVGVAGGGMDNKTPLSGMTTVAGGQANPNFAVNLPAAVGAGSGGALGITLGSIANNAHLNLRLSAMEESGTLRILSSPKILTLDNREAHIEQGTLIPYSQISAQGIQTAFKEAKLNLTVKPHVTADGSVLLEMKVMRDEPDFNNTGARGDPTILKREAETELLVSDGHTAVIGGIFTRNHGTSYKKVPFFADIPIIGWLFKSRSDSDRRSEMLIFITPRIVNRAESIGQ